MGFDSHILKLKIGKSNHTDTHTYSVNRRLLNATPAFRYQSTLIKYYRDMWKSCSHTLTPFNAVSFAGKNESTIKWTKELEEALFHAVKKMVQTENNLLTYPDWMILFTIHTNASDYQLGTVISQNNKPIAFFSSKTVKGSMQLYND